MGTGILVGVFDCLDWVGWWRLLYQRLSYVVFTRMRQPMWPFQNRSVQNKAKHDREIMEKTFLNGEAGAFWGLD